MLTEDELKTLTVPQLKALCKEKGVTAYSKLSKVPLVAKLLEWQTKNTAQPVPPGASKPASSGDSPQLLDKPVPAPQASISSAPPARTPSISPTLQSTSVQPSTETPSTAGLLPSTNVTPAGPPHDARPHQPELPTVAAKAVTLSKANPSSTPNQATTSYSDVATALAPSIKRKKASGTTTSIAERKSTAKTTPLPTAPSASARSTLGQSSTICSSVASTALLMQNTPVLAPAVPKKRVGSALSKDSRTTKKKKVALTAGSTTPSTIAETSSPQPPTLRTQGSREPGAAVLLSFLPAASIPSKRPAPSILDTSLKTSKTVVHDTSVLKIAPKRFVPLRPVSKATREPLPKAVATLPNTHFRLNAQAPVPAPTPANTSNISVLDHIDDIHHDMPTTHQSISMPPSRANRKRVPSWAVILSAVEPTDLRNCALVSRMFRYAVYLSAGVRLERYFRGGRLDRDTKHTSMNMANMWPYLLARQREANEKAGVYARSWLAGILDDRQPIAWKLWACLDNPKQATVAVRFLMTRLYFDVSVEAKTSWRDDSIIVDAQEVLHGEVWKIATREAGRDVQYHVLEATCEVIGLVDPSLPSPATALHDAESPMSCISVRADWSAYVSLRQTSPTVAGDSLLQHVSWEHRGEYDRGISTLWLRRMEREGDVGRVKLAIARRYIYACIVANSVSGQYMRLTEMVQEFHGVETKGIATTEKFRQKQTVKLNLFLPGHHHVESLHFATSKGTPLHPDVAVVQTPGREYYILRDNGMQIGCEEDGVAEVFKKMLGCDRLGVATSTT